MRMQRKMKKLVLVEKNHLIRLGLHTLLGSLSSEWDIIPLDANELEKSAKVPVGADLVVLGLPPDPHDAYHTVAVVEQTLRPARMLVLSEQPASWSPLECGAGSIYACIDKKAAADTLIAAVQLGVGCDRGVFDPAGQVAQQRSWPSLPPIDSASSGEISVEGAEARSIQELENTNVELPPDPSTEASAACSIPPMDENDEKSFDTELLAITPRQYEVLKLLARGHSIKTVARIMNIALATAKSHTASLYRQLKVNSKDQAVYAARRKGALLN